MTVAVVILSILVVFLGVLLTCKTVTDESVARSKAVKAAESEAWRWQNKYRELEIAKHKPGLFIHQSNASDHDAWYPLTPGDIRQGYVCLGEGRWVEQSTGSIGEFVPNDGDEA